MRRSGVPGIPGEGGGDPARRDGDRAGQLGWDDSLYPGDGSQPGQPGGDAVPPPRRSTEDGDGGGAGRASRTDRRKRKKPKPLWRRILVWTAGSLAVIVAGAALAGYLYIEHLNDNITKRDRSNGGSDLEAPEPNADGQSPLNILLLGSDSRDSEENRDLGGARDLAGGPVRADVQMLLHASADRSNISLISIPRDTQVPIPECTDPETDEVYPADESESINNALVHGGPGCVVDTWQNLTGIYIHHFMMVDFAGLVDMADAVGGVPVCVEQNVEDPKTGLRLEAGENVVTGEDALQWLRSRQMFDGSDTTRTRAQQMYLSNMVEELQGSTSLTDPGQLMNLAEAATNALTVDHELGTVQDLYGLAQDLREVPNDRINMVTLPWLPDPNNPTVTVIPDPDRVPGLFELVREDIPLDDPDALPAENEDEGGDASASPEETADPAEDIEIAVVNGTDDGISGPVEGRAGDITDELHRLGFTLAGTDGTPAAEASTVLYYPDLADQANAEAVAAALGIPHSAIRTSTDVERLTLVVGADWREGTSYPEAPADDESGTPEDDEPVVDSDDITSGLDSGEENCMAVNPAYVW